MAITGRRGLTTSSSSSSMMMSPPPPTKGTMPPHGGGMMHMTFFWGTRVQVLFSDWPGDRGIGIYILSLIIVLAASLLLEALSSLSARLSRHPTQPSTGAILTALHTTRMLLAYLLMLAVMSFNVGILIAAVTGHALGFIVCGCSFFKRSRTGGAANGSSEGSHVPAAHDCNLHSAKY